VRAVVDEGRSFIHSTDERYDIIQAALIDTWAASSAGAFALTENNLYTVEAFNLYLSRLNDDGILAMTRWLLDPPQQELRLMSLAREVMRQAGVSRPERRLCLFKAAGRGERVESCFLFKKSEFTDAEILKLEATAAENKLEVLYTPLTRPATVFTELATAANPETFYERYPINVRPTYDNSPFFFYHVTPGDLLKSLRLTNESQKTNLGVFILFGLLIITSILVGIFILGPMFLARRRDRTVQTAAPIPKVVYFALLGLGFIVIEVAIIQRFILFLGYPVYALAVVLFAILLWSGVGSLLTSGISYEKIDKALRLAILGVISVTTLYIFLLPVLFERFGGLQIEWRISIATALLIPLALPLGMPMPLGIKLISRHAPELVPWGWGLNGAASVMGSVAAVIIAMNLGFNQAMMFGCLTYIGAILLVGALGRKSAGQPEKADIIEQAESAAATAGD
jgi:hypothetical protein